jgi:hypothetical protein
MIHEKLVSKMSRCVLLSGEMRSRELRVDAIYKISSRLTSLVKPWKVCPDYEKEDPLHRVQR